MVYKKTLPFFQYIDEDENKKSMEALLLLPEEGQPNALVVLIHGFNKFGAWEHIFQAQRLSAKGYAVLLPSQFGFGKSTGPGDYCGKRTVDAIATMIAHVANEQSILHKNIIVRGASRGAIVVSMLMVRYPDLMGGVILEAGAYDMKKDYEWKGKDAAIKANMEKEMTLNDESFRDRSAYFLAEQIAVPLLLMHGRKDETISVEQAETFSQRLTDLNKKHQMVILEDKGHHIGGPDIERTYILPFIEECLSQYKK